MDGIIGTRDSSIACHATPKPAAGPVRVLGSVAVSGSMSTGPTSDRSRCALPRPKLRGFKLTPS